MTEKKKRLLLVAYHYPPIQGSTGAVRSLSFSRYLQEFGWDVTVLAPTTSAYEAIREENYESIPKHVRVARAIALDARKHLSIGNRYPLLLAIPDRWQSWIVSGALRAAEIVLHDKPDAVMSTYPIASAHYLGFLISRIYRLPWLADFRDPMAQENYPSDKRIRRSFESLEKKVFGHAKRITVTTDGTAELYAKKFPHYPRSSLITVANGFDDDAFANLIDRQEIGQEKSSGNKIVFLHSGLLYPSERDPTEFFAAIAALQDSGQLDPATVEFRFRAAGNEDAYRKHVEALGITDYIHFLPAIPYAHAISEMLSASALMIFQASNCNQQIPAKIYEYLAIRKPIIAFTDQEGDTGRLLKSLGIKSIAALDNRQTIAEALVVFLQSLEKNATFIPDAKTVNQFSRKTQTRLLATTLNEMILETKPPPK